MEETKTERVSPSDNQKVIELYLSRIRESVDAVQNILFANAHRPAPPRAAEAHVNETVEGTFDGESMCAVDGRIFSVPPNYASKSKMVTGDRLKLTITREGQLIYKQVGPVERERVRGILARPEGTEHYIALVGDRSYRVLRASVTYYHGEPGDSVSLLVPKGREARFGAVDTILKGGGTYDPLSVGQDLI